MRDCVLAIDPGLGVSHACLLRVPLNEPLHAPKYDPVAFLTLDTPEGEDLRNLVHHDFVDRIAFVAIESARGQVIKGRSADPVLRNAFMAGRLQAHAALSLDVPALTVPALGTEQGWNWRGQIGAAGMTDDGIRMLVERRLKAPIPTGKRGGKNSHYADAAGLAVAALDRVLAGEAFLPPDQGIRDRWNALSALEHRTLTAKSDARQGRRTARALQKRFA